MTTPRRYRLVSGLALMVALASCASAGTRPVIDASASPDAPRSAVRFENEARDYVHVYLVSSRREWLLGRVEAGAKATLRLPGDALTEDTGLLQLAVIPGARVTFAAARVARETLTLAEPSSEMVSKRWIFSRMPSTGMLPVLQAAPFP